MTTDRAPSLLAEHLERHWPEIAKFFRDRNWPDTKLGNAASCINDDVPQIIAELRWTKVEERLPDDDITVLIACVDADEPVWLGYHDDQGWSNVDGAPLPRVTHWKQLPAGPNG